MSRFTPFALERTAETLPILGPRNESVAENHDGLSCAAADMIAAILFDRDCPFSVKFALYVLPLDEEETTSPPSCSKSFLTYRGRKNLKYFQLLIITCVGACISLMWLRTPTLFFTKS